MTYMYLFDQHAVCYSKIFTIT